MATKIPWTQETINPWVGCTKVKAGCANCYGETMAWRLKGMGKPEWVRGIVEQCQAAHVPVFVKQMEINGKVSHKPEEWPEWGRVQEYPHV